MTTFQNELIAGGEFTLAGGNPANRIARWSLTSGTFSDDMGNSVIIYPNPCSGKFIVDAQGELTIYNTLGEKILSQNILDKTEIDLSNQPKGIYLVQINSEKASVTKKIVIE